MPEIRLRPSREDDAVRLAEIVTASPDLGRQLPSMPPDAEQAREMIRSAFRCTEEKWVWCIECDGRAQGLVGIAVEPEPDILEGPSGRGWVWYWSAVDARGTGAISAAVRTACDWALADQGGRLRRLELGYRENNPASARVAATAGFVVEGRECEKFVVDGTAVDVLTAGRLASDPRPPESSQHSIILRDPRPEVDRRLASRLHHLELWTEDYDVHTPAWRWLLAAIGMRRADTWSQGESWTMSDGAYIVLEQSPDVSGSQERPRAGMNHVALRVDSREVLDRVRAEAPSCGWTELWPDKYPHAGRPGHVALYLENREGFEVEIVAD